MSKARNIVISGIYKDKKVSVNSFIRTKDNQFKKLKYLKIQIDWTDFIIINEQTISSIEILNTEGIQTDTGSSIARGITGGLLLGGAGLIAGAGMGKQSSINLLQINWKDGQKSLIEVDYDILVLLNVICWNIKNNISGDELTKEEIKPPSKLELMTAELNNRTEEEKREAEIESEKAAKGCLITALLIITVVLGFTCPPLWSLVLGYIVYKLVGKYTGLYNILLYTISVLLFIPGVFILFDKSMSEKLFGLGFIFVATMLFPPIRAKINAYFLPKFKNRNILYGIVKFFVVISIWIASSPSMNKSVENNVTNQSSTQEQITTVQKPLNNIPTQQKADTKLKSNNKPTKSENSYYTVANTLENYYKNYFNSDNWYVNGVIPVDNTIHVSMIVVDSTWQENIKKYSSSRQYMVNCACPNSYTDIWHKINKSDVSVTIYDVYGKRIGGGVCTN